MKIVYISTRYGRMPVWGRETGVPDWYVIRRVVEGEDAILVTRNGTTIGGVLYDSQHQLLHEPSGARINWMCPYYEFAVAFAYAITDIADWSDERAIQDLSVWALNTTVNIEVRERLQLLHRMEAEHPGIFIRDPKGPQWQNSKSNS